MPVEPRVKILESLKLAAERMRRVRDAAQRRDLIRQGPEPGPSPVALGGGEPRPVFSGQDVGAGQSPR